ncbi:unnamed protein product [marine sediment metagenome]|uniref:Uncharacterized protein n=1 Tax=marine sediment metagenome TaxID=412755 RepID=X0VKR8_9ZZZZ
MSFLIPTLCLECDFILDEVDSDGVPLLKCGTDKCPISLSKEKEK